MRDKKGEERQKDDESRGEKKKIGETKTEKMTEERRKGKVRRNKSNVDCKKLRRGKGEK